MPESEGDDECLVHKAGNYGDLDPFAAASRRERFAKGEGLPGRAWAEGRPIVLKDLDGPVFRRAEAARSAGLTSAVAIPVFAGRKLKAVLVVLCGSDEDHVGAIEIWEDVNSVLVLDDGYYGTAQHFEWVSQHTRFSHGQGLPGGVRAAATPILMRDLGQGYAFIRAESAGKAGLKTGLGLPIPCPDDKSYVLTLLSAPGTPIARRFEIWDARPTRVGTSRKAMRIDGICERQGSLAPRLNPPDDAVLTSAWQGGIGEVLGTGLPCIRTQASRLPAGYGSMVALPIYDETELAFVVAWYL